MKQRIMLLLVVLSLGLCAGPLYHGRAVSGKTGAGHSFGVPFIGMATALAPTLGTYPNTPVALGGATTVTPGAAPTATTHLNVATDTNFKGTFAADPATGVVRVTNAHPAGTYTVAVTAFDSLGASTTQSFTLTVQPGVACAVTLTFANATDVSAGSTARFAALGDFNGDGKQDLAVANQTLSPPINGTVSIRLGDGLGGFSGTTEVSVGPQPASVAPQPVSVVIGDFNGDGKQDFAAANQGIDTVSIRLGDGMGGFSGATEINVGDRPSEIALGDFNNDGKQDFATSNFGADNVSIRFGNGSGGFTGTTTISVGTGPSGIAIGDFNGDGKQDFAVSRFGPVSIRLGDGTGGFTSAADVNVAGLSRSVAIGDFNNDGKQDLATAGDTSNVVSIRLGNGLGGFTGTTNVSVAGAPFYVAIGDFNGDGKQDFAAPNYNSNNSTYTASIRLGDGLGGFSGNTDVSIGSGQWCVAIGDFNGDGRQDFAIPNPGANNVSIRLGVCNLPPTLTPTDGTLTASQTVSAAQIAAAADEPDAAETLRLAIRSDNPNFGNTATLKGVTVTLTDSNANATGTNPDAQGKVLAAVATTCTAATAMFTLQVTDSSNQSVTVTLTITVNPNQLPMLSYPAQASIPGGTGGTVSPSVGPSDDVAVTGVSVLSITPSDPGGITVNSAGVVSVASSVPTGPYDITIRVTDACGLSDSPFQLVVGCPSFTVGTPTNTGGLGVAYSSSAAANPAASSGFKYQYALVNGTVLPSGLTLDAATGAITGTPTASGNVSFDLKAELVTTGNVATGCSDTKTRSINISCPSFTVGAPTNTGALGVAYSSSAAASPAAPSGFKYQYALANNTVLPGGLTLDGATAAISGTPTASGNFSFDLKAELLTTGNVATGCSNTQTRSLNIACVSNPVVQNLNDSGVGSLREAIARACPGSTITFASGLSGTLTLTSGDLVIDKSLTIEGPGAQTLTLSGNQQWRIFTLLQGPYTITLAGLNLINGNAASQLPLYNGTLGGAIFIVNVGTTTLREVAISGSTALLGSAIELQTGTDPLTMSPTMLNLIGCTLSGNTADISSGRGAIDLRSSVTLNISNSTIAGNFGRAITESIGGLRIVNVVSSTITNNQGGGLVLLLSGRGTVKNSLIAFNSGSDLSGQISSNGYNLWGSAPGVVAQPTDQVGADPLFELDANGKPKLAFNGGPTQTIKLLPGSPALDAGAAVNDPSTNQPLTTDQRGQARPYDFPALNNANGGNGSDIGAYEYQCVALTLGALPGGAAGTAYGQTLNPGGGFAPYNITLASGTLPPGLTLNNGNLSGTPTTSGSFSFTLNVTDAYGCTGSQSYTLTIGCLSLAFTPLTLANGVQGSFYNQTLTTTPAGGNYSYAVTSNVLPPGLTLASNGALTGTPTAGGNYAFAVTVTGWGGCTKTQSYSLLITGTCSTITLNPTSLPTGVLGALYSQALSATGGTAPYTYSVTIGALPAGLTLNASTGELSGTPAASGLSSFTIRATGQGGCAGSRSYVLSIGCGALTFLPATLPNGVKSVTYQQHLSVSPATSATFSLQLGSLPPGFALGSNGLLSGTTTQTGTFNFTVKALAGSCQATKAYTLVIGTGNAALALSGDYDGDGKSDPALWSAKDGTWRIVRSSDGQSVNQRWGTAGDVTLLGDYDGDGKSDLAVFRPAAATFYVKRSSDGGTFAKAWGLSTDIPVPGDYDGDGRTDIAVWRGTEGNWYVLRSADGQTEMQAWGASSAPYLDVPVVGDYDGDGKTDLAVFRKGNGTWFIKRSRDGQMSSKLWGLGTDVPVAQDYDGDGLTDIAVWRGSTWYIWQSASHTVRTVEWGSSAAPYFDQAAPGDYDGDGQADLAVWRGAASTWYVRESRTQSGRTQSLGQNGDRPIGQPTR